MAELPVTFFHPQALDPADTSKLRAGPETDFSSAQWGWIIQTYLHLRDAGYAVAISDALPSRGIVVLSYRCGRVFRRLFDARQHRDLLVVAIRADGLPLYFADVELVQSGRYADGRRNFFMPLWPQPGIIPRDASRGTLVETLSFKGALNQLHPMLTSARWQQFLSDHGLRWDMDAAEISVPRALRREVHWQDYSAVDLVLAVRPLLRIRYAYKPASKLLNAWSAGVPALLGPEYAYQELRRSPLDYIEVASLDDAMRAVSTLRRDGDLYHAMVENGRERSKLFTAERITALWAELLFDRLPRLERVRTRKPFKTAPLQLRSTVGFLRHPNFGGIRARYAVGKALRHVTRGLLGR